MDQTSLRTCVEQLYNEFNENEPSMNENVKLGVCRVITDFVFEKCNNEKSLGAYINSEKKSTFPMKQLGLDSMTSMELYVGFDSVIENIPPEEFESAKCPLDFLRVVSKYAK